MYGAVPPAAATVNAPSVRPLQVTSVCAVSLTDNTVGSVTLTLKVTKQPLASEIPTL